MDIVAGIAAVTEALKLAKELRNVDHEMDKAELKLRLAEITDRLVKTMGALQDAATEKRLMEASILSLKEELHRRGKLISNGGRLYEIDEEGRHIGDPFCNLCYVKEGKLFQLRHSSAGLVFGEYYWCDNCGNNYSA